ncbi:MAG TPA: hypothetical protein VK196_01265, partial [Magnetospirillum sp.]|nr:hypothetical protein [Magnetospirillum sp.]
MTRGRSSLLAMATAIVLATAPVALAAAETPAGIHQAVAAMRKECAVSGVTRGASHQQNGIKRRLAAWLDQQLANEPADADPAALTERLNRSLGPIATDGSCASEPGASDTLGQIEVGIRRNGQLLEARTSIAIECGGDDSAYLYERVDGQWRRFWRGEQIFMPGLPYQPQTITAVHVSPDHGNAADGRLVMALGVEEWCASSWHVAYVRLWRTGLGQPQTTILDDSHFAFLSDVVGPLDGRLNGDEAEVELVLGSIDFDVHSRWAQRRYRIEGSEARRLDPIALTPANFVEEWLTAPWPQSSQWTEPARQDNARRWHGALRDKDGVIEGAFVGEAAGGALHCRADAGLWQVGIEFPNARSGRRQAWFLVR